MPKLVATKAVRYAGKEMAAGEEFDASDKDAKLLIAVHKAELAPPPKRPRHIDSQPKVEPKALKPVEEPAADPKPASGLYQRRDMRAEDGRTGETTSAPSSHRAPRSKAKT